MQESQLMYLLMSLSMLQPGPAPAPDQIVLSRPAPVKTPQYTRDKLNVDTKKNRPKSSKAT